MKRKHIGLIFIDDVNSGFHNKRGIDIHHLKDLKAWLKLFPELEVIAQVKPFFLSLDKKSTTSPEFWEELGNQLQRVWNQFDGFVIFHPLETATFTGSVLSYMFSPPQKPIVFTGSPASLANSGGKSSSRISQWADLSSRANIMNAVQIAAMDVADVVILSGNRLIRANRAERSVSPSLNAFETDEKGLLGRIDFSIQLFPHRYFRKKGRGRHEIRLERQIAVIDLHPGFDVTLLPVLVHGKKGLLLQSRDLPTLEEALKYLPPNLLIVVYVRKSVSLKPFDLKKVILAQTFTFESALTKFMWALGQRRASRKSVERLFSQDVAGELSPSSPSGQGGRV